MDTIIQDDMKDITLFRYFLDHHSDTSGEYGYQTSLNIFPGCQTISVSRDSTPKAAVAFCAHEFVHMKQTLTKRLVLVEISGRRGSSEWFFDGISYGKDPYRRLPTMEKQRDHLPWEYEAYSTQKDWAAKFFAAEQVKIPDCLNVTKIGTFDRNVT
jgi:hypothetical protein